MPLVVRFSKTAAKVRKKIEMCKYMRGKVQNILVLQEIWHVLVGLSERNQKRGEEKYGIDGCL